MSGTEHVANLSQLRPGLWVRAGAENEYFSAMTIYTLLDRGLAALTETGEVVQTPKGSQLAALLDE